MRCSNPEAAAVRSDGFLGGRLTIAQPLHGFRAGMDAVLLAAACPAGPGAAVLEAGCGAGTAILCLGVRVPGLSLTGIEIQPDYAALARANAEANGIPLDMVVGDVGAPPADLRARSFDAVIANPPWFVAGPPAPERGRAIARHAADPEALGLGGWIDAGLRRLRPGGWLTVILPAERLGMALAALEGRAGDVRLLPVAARPGRSAGRVILASRKGARAPLRLLAPLVLHAGDAHRGDREDLTPAAQAILREGQPISLE